MCIICAKPLGKKIKRSILENCYSNNDDGAGFAYVKNNEVYIAKGFFSFEDFWKYYEPLEDSVGLIHFRVGTSGGMNGENCHPWRVADKLAFVHNGIISIDRKIQTLSDTGNFNEQIMKELYRDFPDFWKQKEFKWMIESAIGKGNKLAVMDNEGRIEIFNDSAGKWEEDIWFSNGTYAYKKGCYSSSCNTEWSSMTDDYAEIGSVKHPIVKPFVKSTQSANKQELIEAEFEGIDIEKLDAALLEEENKRLSQKSVSR